jgi:hypothetical protein
MVHRYSARHEQRVQVARTFARMTYELSPHLLVSHPSGQKPGYLLRVEKSNNHEPAPCRLTQRYRPTGRTGALHVIIPG